MEAKQVRDLMEAYASVYEQSMLNTVVDTATNVIKPQVEKQANKKYGPLGGMVAGREVDKIGSDVKSGNYGGALNRAVQGAGKLFNSVDVFDLIKGYLLDEGYAETEEAATVIMANMSEDWKQSIIEQSNTLVTPEQRRADELKYGMRRTTQVPPAKPAGAKRGPRMPL